MKKMTAILIGAGGRGTTYTDIMARVPEKFQVIAVAEPIRSRRDHIKELHNIPDEYCFIYFPYRPIPSKIRMYTLLKYAPIYCLQLRTEHDHLEPVLRSPIPLKYSSR